MYMFLYFEFFTPKIHCKYEILTRVIVKFEFGVKHEVEARKWDIPQQSGR